jgi:hypothetical protein
MDNFSNSNLPSILSPSPESNGKVKGRVKTKHKKVAVLLSMGYPVPIVAKETGLSESRIYHLLSDKDSFANSEMNRILDETLRTRDLFLGNLFFEALCHLDAMMESGDVKERDEAIDQIINLVMGKRTRNGQSLISQYFNFQSQGRQGSPESIDELIIRKRRERDLQVDKKTE